MYVPNFVPEPLEIPGNVTLEPYPTRVRFVRDVCLAHAGYLLVALAAYLFLPPAATPLVPSAAVALGLLFGLDLYRIARRGRAEEPGVSAVVGVVLAVAVGAVARAVQARDLPLGAIGAGPAAFLLYVLAAGRDLSFVGGFFLSWIASTAVLAGCALGFDWPARETGALLTAHTLWLAYWVYDLASLQSRRRLGEAPAAAVDLFRDVFNFLGYVPRCVSHWRRHRIWSAPEGR